LFEYTQLHTHQSGTDPGWVMSPVFADVELEFPAGYTYKRGCLCVMPTNVTTSDSLASFKCRLKTLSSGACLRRRSRCHEFPPSRSVLSASLHSHQSKIHRLQDGLHGSEPGLPWTTNPPSPVVRWACNAGLESSVMILSGVSSVEMSNEGQGDGCGQCLTEMAAQCGSVSHHW